MMKKEETLHEENIVWPKTLIGLDKLKPIEKVFPHHLEYISLQIQKDGCIDKPLIIDKTHHIILDGSHRYAYLKAKGYTLAPVIMVDYHSDMIQVGSHLVHRFINQNHSTLSKEHIIQNALQKKLFDPRVTRHFFPFRKESIPTPLKELQKKKEVNIDFLLSEVTVQTQIDNNASYIKEIDCELKIINQYIQEQLQVKEYLQNQIHTMKNQVKE